MTSSVLRAVGGVVLAMVGGAAPAIGGETCYHLEGKMSEGGRHVDRLYVRTPIAATNFVLASFSPASDLAATVFSDTSGRGSWQRDLTLDLGEWECLVIEFETAHARQVLLWAHQPTGKLYYQGHDAAGRLLFSGEGKRR